MKLSAVIKYILFSIFYSFMLGLMLLMCAIGSVFWSGALIGLLITVTPFLLVLAFKIGDSL